MAHQLFFRIRIDADFNDLIFLFFVSFIKGKEGILLKYTRHNLSYIVTKYSKNCPKIESLHMLQQLASCKMSLKSRD